MFMCVKIILLTVNLLTTKYNAPIDLCETCACAEHNLGSLYGLLMFTPDNSDIMFV